MVKIVWTSQAIEDFESICQFIEKDSRYYSSLFANKIFEAVDDIQKFPQIGRILPEKNQDNIREILLGNYRIIYRLHESFLEILSIYHGSRLINPENY